MRSRTRRTAFSRPAGDLSSCSQNLTTVMPRFLRSRPLRLSRLRFRSNLEAQKLLLVAGIWPHLEQPCQKQPSMKTATPDSRKKKSGLPGRLFSWTIQPEMPVRIKPIRNRNSVVRFPLPRIAPIVAERFDGTPSKELDPKIDWRYLSIWGMRCDGCST